MANIYPFSQINSSATFFEWAAHADEAVERISNIAKAVKINKIIPGSEHNKILNKILEIQNSPSYFEELDPEMAEVLIQLENHGYRPNDFPLLLTRPAKFSDLGRTAPLLIVDYEKDELEMKCVIKFTDYKEFLSQRVYRTFLQYCPQMQNLNLRVCRTTAITNLFGETPRYHIDAASESSNESVILDSKAQQQSQNAIKSLLTPVQFHNWSRLEIPVVLISEKVEGSTLREFIQDGKFEKLPEEEKYRLCAQLGMSSAIDLVFGNHDRIVHDTDRSNLGNVMLTREGEGPLNCWLIDNGDVPSNFGEGLKFRRKDYIYEDATYKKAMYSLKKWENNESMFFSKFIDFLHTPRAEENFRAGISDISAFLEDQFRSPNSELNQQLEKISATRLVPPPPVAASFNPAGKYIPRHRREALPN